MSITTRSAEAARTLGEAKVFNEQFAGFVVGEILQAKARWYKEVLRAILPTDLYKDASRDNNLSTATKWAKDNGYAVHELKGRSEMRQHGRTVAVFEPRLVVTGKEPGDRRLDFVAVVEGRQVNVEPPSSQMN